MATPFSLPWVFVFLVRCTGSSCVSQAELDSELKYHTASLRNPQPTLGAVDTRSQVWRGEHVATKSAKIWFQAEAVLEPVPRTIHCFERETTSCYRFTRRQRGRTCTTHVHSTCFPRMGTITRYPLSTARLCAYFVASMTFNRPYTGV